MVVTRVNPLSCAKIAAVIYAIMGLLFGVLFSLLATLGAFATPDAEAGMLGAVFGIGAVVFMPIFYGCMGFVMTLIGAALYNAVAGVIGGVEIDVA
jgi:hypothetical protein